MLLALSWNELFSTFSDTEGKFPLLKTPGDYGDAMEQFGDPGSYPCILL